MKNWKRYLSIAMTLVMLLGVLPTAAFAEEGVDPQTDPIVVEDLQLAYGEGQTTEFTYSGQVQVPQSIVVSSETQTGLTADDYDLVYWKGDTEIASGAIQDAGTYTIQARLKGQYEGTSKNSLTFTIKPLAFAESAIAVTNLDSTYGDTVEPVVTCTKADNSTITLTADDYDVDYSGTNADSQTATVRLKGNYAGTKTQGFTINPKPMTKGAIADIANQTYTGSAITPVVVEDGKTTLTKDTDYTVVYSNNTNVGTASAEVTFTGNYSGGPFTKEFTIVAKSISAAVLGGLNTTYNPGSRPVPTVTLDGKPLMEGTDYDLTYDDTTAGRLIIKVNGKGNYTGTAQATVAVLATSDTTAPVISGVTNGGTYHEAKTITVTDTNLDRVEVHHNGSVSTSRPADTNPTTLSVNLAFSNTPYQIKAYDKVGNKTEFTVTVTKKTVTSSMITIAGADNIVYDGTAKTPTITVKDGSTTIAADQYTLSWENNTNAGTATVKVTMNNNAAYKGEATKTFTIKPKALTSSAIQEIDNQTYTGNPIEPTITVKDGDSKTLDKGSDKDYTVSYTNNINPGTAKVTVVLRGNYTGTLEKTFTIGKDLSALENNIKTLAAKTTLTYAEKQQIKQLKAAYDALSASEKATVDREVGSALMTSFKNKASAAAFKLLNKPSVDYYKYVKGTSSNVVIQIDADYSRTLVTEIRMGKNLTVIDPANYTVTEGSVVVTLSSSYLKQIKDAGKYNLYIDLMDTQTGHTETVQTVVRVVPATDIPQTGDPFRMNLWVGLLGASVLALAGLGVYEVVKKKKNAQKRLEAAMELGEEPSDEANTNE